MTTIKELKTQIKIEKLNILSNFLKEQIELKKELERKLKEVNQRLEEFYETYGTFYENLDESTLNAFIKSDSIKDSVKDTDDDFFDDKPARKIRKRKPMSEETKAKISRSMKNKFKSKPISKAKAKEDEEEYTSVEKAEVKEVEKENLVKDLDMFRKELSKVSSVKKSFYSDGESEDE